MNGITSILLTHPVTKQILFVCGKM